MERCPRAHGVERGTPGERLEIYWPYTHTGHTTSGHPATTLTGAVLLTKYRGITRHITGSHGARVAPSAQVHLLPSAGAQQQQYCSPASAGHPPAVSLQRSGAGRSQAADVGRTHQERQECPVEGHANASTERVDLIQVGVQRISCTILEGSSNTACALPGRSSARCPVQSGVALGVASNSSNPLFEVNGPECTNQATTTSKLNSRFDVHTVLSAPATARRSATAQGAKNTDIQCSTNTF